MNKQKQYWLLKSEPSSWSWEQQVKKGTESWNGVRNYQAANNMKAMNLGDLCFFYHSNDGKEIVGIVEVVKLYYPDPTDEAGRFGMVDVKTLKPLKIPVTLHTMKAHDDLQAMALIRQSRLSVCPVTPDEWVIICKLGGV
jgi:predicted RNA-binding protein with PUA-like domain